jgi:RNA 3'-terminal phosphate cyclase (ATP)
VIHTLPIRDTPAIPVATFRSPPNPLLVLDIDGTDGGGQMLRTALSLAALSGEPFRMRSIRGARPTPGLRPQHLGAVEVAARACDATVAGATVGADTIEFTPGPVSGGTLTYHTGTAASVTLLFDTLLPLAAALDSPLDVTVTGGTDVKWSPPFDFFRDVKLPVLGRMGLEAEVTLHRRGFYPVGGGRATLRVSPSTPARTALTERGPLAGAVVHSIASTHLEGSEVADRQATAAADVLRAAGCPAVETRVSYSPADSPGSACVVAVDYGVVEVGFGTLGERGKPAETVGREAAGAWSAFHAGAGVVDDHLADQLMVPLALGGGTLRAPRRTAHIETNAAVIRAFGYDLSVEEDADGVEVSATGSRT